MEVAGGPITQQGPRPKVGSSYSVGGTAAMKAESCKAPDIVRMLSPHESLGCFPFGSVLVETARGPALLWTSHALVYCVLRRLLMVCLSGYLPL